MATHLYEKKLNKPFIKHLKSTITSISCQTTQKSVDIKNVYRRTRGATNVMVTPEIPYLSKLLEKPTNDFYIVKPR